MVHKGFVCLDTRLTNQKLSLFINISSLNCKTIFISALNMMYLLAFCVLGRRMVLFLLKVTLIPLVEGPQNCVIVSSKKQQGCSSSVSVVAQIWWHLNEK